MLPISLSFGYSLRLNQTGLVSVKTHLWDTQEGNGMYVQLLHMFNHFQLWDVFDKHTTFGFSFDSLNSAKVILGKNILRLVGNSPRTRILEDKIIILNVMQWSFAKFTLIIFSYGDYIAINYVSL